MTMPPPYLIAAVIVLGLVALAMWVFERRARQRTQLLTAILDLADDFERSLHECRARLRRIPGLVAHTPSPDPLSAHATLAAEPQVQAALRDLLGHRLWLKAHAADASVGELRAAHDSLVQSRAELDAQLQRLATAAAELGDACEAARSDATTSTTA